MAARGFRRLSDFLSQATVTTGGSAERMRSLARVYVRFAVDHGMLFRPMFGAELSGPDQEELCAAGRDSYVFIEVAVAARLDELDGGRVTSETGSLGVWALVHGLAMLLVDEKVEWPATEATQDALISQVASVYSMGLG